MSGSPVKRTLYRLASVPSVQRVINRVTASRHQAGAVGVEKLGHRKYVGGMWEEMGRHQFEFLVAQGLQPSNVLVDVACGSLRGGVWYVPYLDRGNYLGIEKEGLLLERGLAHELPEDVREAKAPELVESDAFEFDRFTKTPDWGIAQSLFSHLTAEAIELCLTNLRASCAPGCRFFATYLESPKPIENPATSDALLGFRFTRDEMAKMGAETGWTFRYIGDWGHPRNQVMTEYLAD